MNKFRLTKNGITFELSLEYDCIGLKVIVPKEMNLDIDFFGFPLNNLCGWDDQRDGSIRYMWISYKRGSLKELLKVVNKENAKIEQAIKNTGEAVGSMGE